jgi:LacI family transcriptional regulator
MGRVMAKVTIEDISRFTGLSRGTVSRALNDRPDISGQTRQRVLDACRSLNYSPSHAARCLAMGRAFAVAVLIDDLQSAFAATFLRGVLSRARSARYAVFVVELGRDEAGQLEAVDGTVGERIDCVLVSSPLSAGVTPVLMDRLSGRPAMACMPLDGFDCDLLMPDQVESGRLVGRHLLDEVGGPVLYVHGEGRPGAAERLEGFEQSLREQGLDPAASRFELPPQRPLPEAIEGELVSRLRQTRAVGASDDLLALELLGYCWRAGRRPGRDIAVMGQGNERCAALINPSLTTTDWCGEEIGRRALEILLARVEKRRLDAPQSNYIAPVLCSRASTQLPR